MQSINGISARNPSELKSLAIFFYMGSPKAAYSQVNRASAVPLLMISRTNHFSLLIYKRQFAKCVIRLSIPTSVPQIFNISFVRTPKKTILLWVCR